MPTALSPAEAQRWNSAHLDEIVAVEPFEYRAYSDSLVSALRDTHLFAEVALLGDTKATPTLIASIDDRDYGGVATIPIWTFLTLGIVPIFEKEGYGYHFSLSRPNDSKTVHVRYDFESNETGGWLALFELFLPNVGWGSPEWSDRYHGRFALTILDQIGPAGR